MLCSKSAKPENVDCPIKNGDSDDHDVKKNVENKNEGRDRERVSE